MTHITDSLQDAVNFIYKFIPQKTPTPEALQEVRIIAHRGSWNLEHRLENTIAAFDHCLNKNIWAIEFDIRWTADNVPMVHHDQTTKRVFNKNITIANTRFSELREQLPLIPTLDEIITRYSGKLHFMIEIKDNPSPEQAKILKDILKNIDPVQDYHFMCLELDFFKNLNFVTSKCFVSIAKTNIRTIFKHSLKQNFGGFTGQYLLLSNKMRHGCHQQGIKVGTGFPTEKNSFYREINRGIDWIFTNHSTELAQLKDTSQSS